MVMLLLSSLLQIFSSLCLLHTCIATVLDQICTVTVSQLVFVYGLLCVNWIMLAVVMQCLLLLLV